IEHHFQGDLEQAIRTALAQVRGSYAMAVVSSHDKQTLYAARKDSPLVIGLGEGEQFLASDIPAVLAHTRQVIVLEDGDFAIIHRDGVQISPLDGTRVERAPLMVPWDAQAAEKGGSPHFMHKEIHEQPAPIRDPMRGRLTADLRVDLPELGLAPAKLQQI